MRKVRGKERIKQSLSCSQVEEKNNGDLNLSGNLRIYCFCQCKHSSPYKRTTIRRVYKHGACREAYW